MKKILIIFTMTLLVISCKKNIQNLNEEIKKPTQVSGASLFSNAQKNMIDAITTPNVNSGIFRLLAQHWTETTYTDESNYDLNTRNIPQNFWNAIYRDVLKNLSEAKKVIPTTDPLTTTPGTIKNQLAMTDIMMVYSYSILVSTYGDIPYNEALNINNLSPKYDDAKTIFYDLLLRLDTSLANINVAEQGFGVNDLFFAGNANYPNQSAAWVKFGNSLKLRMGMMIADVDAPKAKATVEAAASKVISSNAENVLFRYLGAPPNTNPIWVNLVQSGRKDFVAANTLVDTMKSLQDPRIPLYFTLDADAGYSGGEYGGSNNYAKFSKPSTRITKNDFEAIVIDYSEVEFLLAEAKERGFNVAGTAIQHYNSGVTASIIYWGGTTADATAYLLKPLVNYGTALGSFKAKIGFQKWIALYNRGFEAWTEWRRLDAPALVAPPDANSDIPIRYTYPVQEQNLNTKNYNAASTAIGGDKVETKLFWDKF